MNWFFVFHVRVHRCGEANAMTSNSHITFTVKSKREFKKMQCLLLIMLIVFIPSLYISEPHM